MCILKLGKWLIKLSYVNSKEHYAAFKYVYKSLYQQLETHDMILSDNRNKDDIYCMITYR